MYRCFKDIKSLQKGSCLTINNDGTEEIYVYADIKNAILNSGSLNLKNDEEKHLYLKDIVDETVKYHQVSDIPITVLLSSGIDSNAILGSISNDDKKNCSAITMKFNDKNLKDEVALAQHSALMNKIPHHISQKKNGTRDVHARADRYLSSV